MDTITITPIAIIYNDYTSKFAIPRQSGIADSLISEIVFEKPYKAEECIRGIEKFSHLWLIWGFSEVSVGKWSPTVRPPRLGGNKRMGVFATRSPFRPNSLGLSSVKLVEVEKSSSHGMILKVTGADILNGTPIYDIKPYLPMSDCHSDAIGGFTNDIDYPELDVVCPDDIICVVPFDKRDTLISILKQDPRPQYHNDPDRVYGFLYADMEIKFKVGGNTLTVVDIHKNH